MYATSPPGTDVLGSTLTMAESPSDYLFRTSERRREIALSQKHPRETTVARRLIWRDGDLAWLGRLLCLLSALITVAILWWVFN